MSRETSKRRGIEKTLRWWQDKVQRLENIVNRTGSKDMAAKLELAKRKVQYYRGRLM